MNLIDINPPLRPGQTVVCSGCGSITNKAKADPGTPFAFYCNVCQSKENES